jgi:hypothetical protein
MDLGTKCAPPQGVYRSYQAPQGPLTGQLKLERLAVQLIPHTRLGCRHRPVRLLLVRELSGWNRGVSQTPTLQDGNRRGISGLTLKGYRVLGPLTSLALPVHCGSGDRS